MAPNYVDFMDLEDLRVLCLDGFDMVHFWLHCKLKALLLGWARWYVYVDKVAAVGSRITLLLEDDGKAAADTEALARQLWLAYRDYFGSRWVVEQPGLRGDRRNPETTYDDCKYEVEEDKLMCFTWYVYVDKEDERGSFGRLVDERMAAMPRMGEVFRTEPNGSDCLLWCKTNDTDERRKAATLRLWYPDEPVTPQVHSIRLTHPRLVFPGGERTKPWDMYDPWANDIMKIHVVSGKMLERIKEPEEWGDFSPRYVDFIDLEDLSVLCLDGLHMVHFWLHCKLKDLLVGWARWYVYVDKVAAVGSRITVLLQDEGKAAADAEALARQLWLAYRDYFGSRWVVEQPGLLGDMRKPEIAYDDCQYEVEEDKLLCVTTSEGDRGDFGRLIDERMAAMPRVGEVFRTEPNSSDCLLWCKTNDTDERRKAATLRLWYPEQ
ncbi:sulfotransferase 6B1 [Sarotherodon galilaeus]